MKLLGFKMVYEPSDADRVVKRLDFEPEDYVHVPAGWTLVVTVQAKAPRKRKTAGKVKR